MACACKVNKQIAYLQKKYGHEIPVSKQKIITFNIVEFLKAIAVWLIALPIIPFMIIHIIIKAFTKRKSISVKNLMSRIL